MTLPLLEGLSSGVGDELNDLAGLRSTRLTQPLRAEHPVESAVGTSGGTAGTDPIALPGIWTWNGTTTVLATNTTTVGIGDFIRLDADGQLFQITGEVANVSVTVSNPGGLAIPTGTGPSSSVGPTVVTLAAGVFSLAAPGDRFRLTSTANAGRSARINTVNSPTQLTLRLPLLSPPAIFSLASWEIVTEPETTASVEDVTFWTSPGRFILQGTLYRYSSRVPLELRGLEHWDDTAWSPGARYDHPVLSEVVDWNRDFSAVDRTRRGFLVEFATGDDLTALGRNLGVPRPPELGDDELYRALIRAVAYGAKGTPLVVERALDALIEGRWERFEDFTGANAAHFAKLFLRRTDIDPTNPLGRGYLGGEVRRPITSTTAIALTETPLRVGGVRFADDPVEERLIASGVGASSTDGGFTINGPALAFPTRIQRGDLFMITSGPRAGRIGTVQTRVSATQLTLGVVRGADNLRIGFSFQSTAWKIIRPISNFRHYLPSAEVYLEYPGDTGTTIWTWAGVATTEGASVGNVDDSVLGLYLNIGDPSNAATSGYFHPLRVRPESVATFELQLGFAQAGIGTGATNGRQITGEIRDGARILAWGVIGDGSGTFARIGFIDASTGSFINAAGSVYPYVYTVGPTSFRSVRIEKRGTNRVLLIVDGRIADSVPYASFPATAENRLQFGCFSTAVAPVMWIKHADWSCSTPTDYWNSRRTGATLAVGSRQLANLGGIAAVGQIGHRVVISDYSALNPSGGSPFGEWEVESFASANAVILNGPRKRRAVCLPGLPNRIQVRGDDFAFRFPHARGHQIQLLSGPNAGTRTILRCLDPVTGLDLAALPGGTLKRTISGLAGFLTSHASIPEEVCTSVVEVDGAPFVLSGAESDYRIVPVFATDAAVACEISDTSSRVGVNLTLAQALPYGISGGWTPLVSVLYSVVLSGQLSDESDQNVALGSGNYQLWPLYLSDFWGYVRRVIQAIVVAGVIVDFDSLQRDASGLHIVED